MKELNEFISWHHENPEKSLHDVAGSLENEGNQRRDGTRCQVVQTAQMSWYFGRPNPALCALPNLARSEHPPKGEHAHARAGAIHLLCIFGMSLSFITFDRCKCPSDDV